MDAMMVKLKENVADVPKVIKYFDHHRLRMDFAATSDFLDSLCDSETPLLGVGKETGIRRVCLVRFKNTLDW